MPQIVPLGRRLKSTLKLSLFYTISDFEINILLSCVADLSWIVEWKENWGRKQNADLHTLLPWRLAKDSRKGILCIEWLQDLPTLYNRQVNSITFVAAKQKIGIFMLFRIDLQEKHRNAVHLGIMKPNSSTNNLWLRFMLKTCQD